MAQKDVPEWFSFYPYEFIADERVAYMTLEEVGAYVKLLCHQWINGSIPCEIPALARILKRTTAEMELLWPAVGPCFEDRGEGRMVQKRLDGEREAACRRLAGWRKGAARQAQARREESERVSSGRALCTVLSSSNSLREEPYKISTPGWEWFCANYPAHRLDVDLACQMWIGRADDSAIVEGLKCALESEDWRKEGGRYIPMASRFIADGKYKIKYRPAESASAPVRYRPPEAG